MVLDCSSSALRLGGCSESGEPALALFVRVIRVFHINLVGLKNDVITEQEAGVTIGIHAVHPLGGFRHKYVAQLVTGGAGNWLLGVAKAA